MAHAAYALLGDLTIVYGQTTKTACGKRAKTSALVSRDTTDCQGCREQIAADRVQLVDMVTVVDALKAQGLLPSS